MGAADQYTVWYVDDFTITAKDPAKVMEEFQKNFMIKIWETNPKRYLGSDVEEREGMPVFSAKTYLDEILSTVAGPDDPERKLKVRKVNSPMPEDCKPEEDDSPLLGDADRRRYLRYIGIFVWLTMLGRYDLVFTCSSLSRFNAMPRVGHMALAIRVFGYLRDHRDVGVGIDPRDIPNLPSFDESVRASLKKAYEYSEEEHSRNDPEALGNPISLTIFVDSDWAHDTVTRRSITGIVVLMGRTPIYVKAIRQTAVETSSFSAEFSAARTAVEIAIGFRLAFRSFGVPLKGPTKICGDNLGVIQQSTLLSSPLRKKHTSISYHRCRSVIAAGTVGFVKVKSKENISDLCTKPVGGMDFMDLLKSFMWVGRSKPCGWPGARSAPQTISEEEKEEEPDF
jgi:hypothetical protein